VGREGVRVLFIESEDSAGWGGPWGGVGAEREGNKRKVRKGDGGNIKVMNKGESVMAR